MENQPEIVRYLLAHGANPNIPDRDNEAVLHRAALSGNKDLIKILSDAGANLEYQSGYQKQTPLFYSANVDTIKELIKAGAHVNARDEHGRTPLYYIADQYAQPVVHELLRAGADINNKDNWDTTPLHRATQREKPNLIKALLENGADVTIRDYRGNLAYNYAQASNNREILDLFEKYKPMPTDPTRSKRGAREPWRFKKIDSKN
jgi:ankyrin repeat protein